MRPSRETSLSGLNAGLIGVIRGRTRAPAALRRLLGVLVVVVPLGYVTLVLADGAPSVLASLPTPGYELVAAAIVVNAFCTGVGGLLWSEVLSALGFDLGLRSAAKVHFVSIPGKYVPILGLQYVGKVGLTARAGVPPIGGTAAITLEFVVIGISGVLAALAVLPMASGSLPPDAPWRFVSALGPWPALAFGVTAPLALSTLAPPILSRLKGCQCRLSYSRALLWIVGVGVNWLLLGLSVFLMAGSVYGVRLQDLPTYQFAVVASLLAGLMALTPLGLGVREGVLTVALSPVLGAPQAAVLAVAWRLLGLVGEGLCLLVSAKL